MRTVVEIIGFSSISLLVCTVFFLLGVYTIRKPESTAGFFNKVGSQMCGKKIADRLYSSRNILWAGWAFAIFTLFTAAQATYQIVHAIVTGAGN